ncbi:MAG: hypothetical protein ACXWXO_16975, partial [Nocardioides sp.]
GPGELAAALRSASTGDVRADADGLVVRPAEGAASGVAALAFAHGWEVAGPVEPADSSAGVRLRPITT